jgi:hypothetical protein
MLYKLLIFRFCLLFIHFCLLSPLVLVHYMVPSCTNSEYYRIHDLFNQIRKKLVIFVHFKGFNISQKPKSSPLWYFAQKTSLNLAPNWYPIVFTGIGQTLMSRPVCVSCSTQNLYKMAPYNVQEQGEIISKNVWTINKNEK